MPIEFHCTECNRLMRTPDASAGKKGQCPQCGAVLEIPLKSSAGSKTTPAVPASNAPGVIELSCPSCKRSLRVPATNAGKQGMCPHCSSRIQIPAEKPVPSGTAASEPIQFNCTSCKQLVRTPPATAGKKGQCPHCGGVVQIPLVSTVSATTTSGPLDDLFPDVPTVGETAGPLSNTSTYVPPGWADPKAAARAKKKHEAKQPKPKVRRDWGPRDGLPWEHVAANGRFWGTTFKILFSPGQAFGMMRRRGGIGQPLTYAIGGAACGAIITVIYQCLAFGIMIGMALVKTSGRDPTGQISSMAAAGAIQLAVTAVMLLVFGILGAILGSFLTAGLYHVVLMLLDAAEFGFETTYRVVAYTQGAMGPLAIVPCLGGLIQLVAYPILAIIGLSSAQETSPGKAAIAVFAPLLLCCLVLVPIGLLFGGALVAAIQAAQQAAQEAAQQAP